MEQRRDTVELELFEPTAEYAEQSMDYRREFLESGDSMDGASGLRRFDNAADWLEWCRLAKDAATCPPGWIPDIQYITVRRSDNRLVGMIDIRLGTDGDIMSRFGQIGYSVRPSERGLGYAVIQLRLALDICRGLGMERLLVTCDAATSPPRGRSSGTAALLRTKSQAPTASRHGVTG